MDRVIVFGATSAIAGEVAALYAERGDALHLVGRNPDKLAALANRLEAARPQTTVADLDDLGGNERLVWRVIESLGGADVVLITHGLLGDQLQSEHDLSVAEQIVRTNFLSPLSLLIPLANHFSAARGGRLGVITTVAAERGRPRNYTYGAAKAGLNTYLQGIRSRLHASETSVTTLKLGPVETPMTENHRKNAFFAQPQGVAREIVAALDARRSEVFIPKRWAAIMPVVRLMPEPLFQRLPFLSGR
ncbi:MAG TPA: SDR family NAD(P)-dependent oxidoreductase [Polyangiales bacterium]|nr:SDR family NAD(P)-dependent oxidoreductase [Polyangiales bacterium]